MPKAIKKRVSKPEVKAEESVRSIVSFAADRIASHYKAVAVMAAAAFVVAVGAVVFYMVMGSGERKAREAFYDGYRLYYGLYDAGAIAQGERLERALESFEKSYRARPTPQALMYSANAKYALGRHSEALASLEELLSRFPADDVYAPLALYKAAMIKVKLGKPEEALGYLERLYSSGAKTYRDIALAESAGILDGLGRAEEARAKYEAVLKEFPDSPFAEEAKFRLKKKDEPEKAEKGG